LLSIYMPNTSKRRKKRKLNLHKFLLRFQLKMVMVNFFILTFHLTFYWQLIWTYDISTCMVLEKSYKNILWHVISFLFISIIFPYENNLLPSWFSLLFLLKPQVVENMKLQDPVGMPLVVMLALQAFWWQSQQGFHIKN